MPPTSAGKQRATRIQLDYHKRPDILFVAKITLSIVAVVVAVAYLFWPLVAPSAGVFAFSHGPVAEVHSTWENKCSACHVDFVPIRSDTLAARWAGTSNGDAANPINPDKQTDQKCQACHRGPTHHASANIDHVVSCGTCHQEHQGRLTKLNSMDDIACTRCHQDLSTHIVGAKEFRDPPIDNVITDFATEHPKFRSLNSDPGAIKFTHLRHMRRGLNLSNEDKFRRTLADLPEEYRERYRGADQQDHADDKAHLIQLECASCHQLDTQDAAEQFQKMQQPGNFGGSRYSARSSGEYMVPVSFEKDCKACHPLYLPPGSKETIEHGRTAEQIREILASRFWERYLKQKPELAQQPVPQRPQPGYSPDPETIQMQEAVRLSVATAERHLRVVCNECHYLQEMKDSEVKLTDVRPANVPQVWLRHARFSHAAHRASSCLDCHPKATTSEKHTDVMIVGREVCLKCHSPVTSGVASIYNWISGAENRDETAGVQLGGAAFGCVKCHRYHDGQGPLHGLGTKSRGPTIDHTLLQFLRGDSTP